MSRRYDDILFTIHAEEPLMGIYDDYVFFNNELIHESKVNYFSAKFIELNCQTVVDELAEYPELMNNNDIITIFESQDSIY